MTVHVFGTMGTVVSLRFDDGALDQRDLDDVENIFRGYDRTFSLYDEASPLSRIARGELALTAADEEVRVAYAVAVDWRGRTGGAFTPHRPDGVIDLSGVVKALAIADAGARLDTVCGDWLLSVGGDVLRQGLHEGAPWRVGVVDPHERDSLAGLTELRGSRRALATSGTAERGEHIWRRAAPDLVQVTVAADDIVTADVLATAIIADGHDGLDRITADFDVDVLAFDSAGAARATPGAREWIQR